MKSKLSIFAGINLDNLKWDIVASLAKVLKKANLKSVRMKIKRGMWKAGTGKLLPNTQSI